LILVTNDDGVSPPEPIYRDGKYRRRFSSSDRPQSGMGHAINEQHLYLNKILKENDGIEEIAARNPGRNYVNEKKKAGSVRVCAIMDLTSINVIYSGR
jgi:hypothetical protein